MQRLKRRQNSKRLIIMLPIGRKVRITLRGAANPEIVGVLEIDDRLLLFPDPAKAEA